MVDAGVLSPELLGEYLDMAARHPCYFRDQCPLPVATHSHSSSSGSTSSTGMGSNVEQWRSLVATYFPEGAVNNMLCIMRHESGGNPTADNDRSTARGLFQVLKSWPLSFGYSYADLYDPNINVLVAKKVWDIQGYGAWTVWWKCR